MASSRPRILIVGAGPAGIAAGIQLQRYGLEPVILEKEKIGGLLRNANWVENYPGFPNGVAGSKLITLMEKQVKRIGVQVEREEVVQLDWDGENFVAETQNAKREVEVVIVASGTESRKVPEVISAAARARVFTEVWPLLKIEGRHIVIVGAGDAAFDYALNLSKKRNSVTILNRGDSVKCLGLLWERASLEPAITYRAGVAVSHVDADETAARLKVRCEAGGSSEEVTADYVIFAIGRDPQLDFLSENLKRCEKDLIETGRLYFVGDVQNGLLRQTAIAVGDGLRAAMQIHAKLEK
ncbi:MAG: NAD(P)/FAD-dependent oxidoreductase [Chloroflexota bacterium]